MPTLKVYLCASFSIAFLEHYCGFAVMPAPAVLVPTVISAGNARPLCHPTPIVLYCFVAMLPKRGRTVQLGKEEGGKRKGERATPFHFCCPNRAAFSSLQPTAPRARLPRRTLAKEAKLTRQ